MVSVRAPCLKCLVSKRCQYKCPATGVLVAKGVGASTLPQVSCFQEVSVPVSCNWNMLVDRGVGTSRVGTSALPQVCWLPEGHQGGGQVRDAKYLPRSPACLLCLSASRPSESLVGGKPR